LDVLILIGSKNDLSEIDGALQTLKKLGVSYELHISSAHRTLKRTVELVESAEKNGVKVIIAAAGMSAHLPGVVSALTVLPVIGVPLNASALNGLDSLLSIVQMPAGIPVATTAIGKNGCVNAALLAASILAISNASLTEKLKKYREEMEKSVINADNELNSKVI
jgi:5-(carboxyamino)imidazole ribonucleotide mutase